MTQNIQSSTSIQQNNEKKDVKEEEPDWVRQIKLLGDIDSQWLKQGYAKQKPPKEDQKQKTAKSEVKSVPKGYAISQVALLYFTGSWCKPSEEIYEDLIKLIKNNQIPLFKVNVFQSDLHPELLSHYNVTETPTFVLIKSQINKYGKRTFKTLEKAVGGGQKGKHIMENIIKKAVPQKVLSNKA